MPLHLRLRSLLLIAASPILFGTSYAETFHLKDGRVLEGRIAAETEESYVLEVLVARGIRDEITVAKEDIEKIERRIPEQTEFARIKNMMPIPDLLKEEDYTQRIDIIRDFLSKFPESETKEEAREILKAHLGELKAIEVGAVKLNGNLIRPSERQANRYYIDSRIAEAEIRAMAAANRLQALRAFKNFEREFNGSEAWHELLPLARQLATAQKSHAQELIAGFDALIARREAGLTRMSNEERTNSLRAIAERETAYRQRYEQERSMRDFWPSISQDFRPSLDDTVRFADQEIRRLSNAISQPLRQPTPSQIWRDAVTKATSRDETERRSALQLVRSARIPQRYIDEIQSLIDANS